MQATLLGYQNGFATSAEKASAWKQFALFVKRNKASSIAPSLGWLVLAGVKRRLSSATLRFANAC